MNVPNSMRTQEGELEYQRAKQNQLTKPLNEEPVIEQWENWALIENRFPYDLVFTTHNMLVPTRTFENRHEMRVDELHQLNAILAYLSPRYDIYFENTPRQRSVKNLYHIHLAVWKQREEVTNG